MTSNQPTPATAALVAIDIAKLRNEVLIEVPEARRRQRLVVVNTRAEHDRLVADLHALGRPITIGLEPTGHYHRPLAWRLVQAGFDVRLISSVALARTREALHNGWDKNDPKDAQVILHMLRIGAAKARLLGDIYNTAQSTARRERQPVFREPLQNFDVPAALSPPVRRH
jgi:transposase